MSGGHTSAALAQECTLLLFEVGGQVFAADPREVTRIDRFQPFLPTLEILPTDSKRVLIARSANGEFQVPVDSVRGVQQLPVSALRRPPALAQAVAGARAAEVMGMVLLGAEPVLIVDMQALSARQDGRASSQGT